MYSTRVISADISFQEQELVKPLILSTGAIERITQATATVSVLVGGVEGTGHGSIYLSDLWAWPDPSRSHHERDQLLRALTTRIGMQLGDLVGGEPAHPLELGLRLHHSVNHISDPRYTDVPVLARSMCLSPFDAAIHDAAGIALNRSSFALYDVPVAIPSADAFFPDGVCKAISSSLRGKPLTAIPAWLVVGKNDDLESDIRPWIQHRGYRCLKLKLMGRDNRIDVQRTLDVFNAVRSFGAQDIRLSIDSNEANPDAESVYDYLLRLRAASPGAFDALQYVEQPTGRDITQHRFDWRRVTKLKPVLLDEGLTDLSLFKDAEEQGWSGFALKTCKGHSFTLIAAGWAMQKDLIISLQDLTNPGYAMIHAALLGAYLPTINGAELNSPQFTPAANEPWLTTWPGLFLPGDGVHRLAAGTEIGLGSQNRVAP